jgi:hypothetical protein
MGENNTGKKLLGAYLEELGICTSEQVEQALNHCTKCSKAGRFIPIGQALVELGYTTMHDINHALQLQDKDRVIAHHESTDQIIETPVEDEEQEEQEDEQPEVRTTDQIQAEMVDEPEELEEPDIFTSEQAERLGIFAADEVGKALEYCTACSKRQRFVSLGQALVELGYATRDYIDTILRIRHHERTFAHSEAIMKIPEIPAKAEQVKELGEQVKKWGLCTSEQVNDALGYWEDCSKRQRYISIGQALIELNYTTQGKIDEILKIHAKVKASNYAKGMVNLMEIPAGAEQARGLCEQAKKLGICTSEQVEDALGYWEDCSKRRRYISISQALVELGYMTMYDIDAILQMQGREGAYARSQGLAATEEDTDSTE